MAAERGRLVTADEAIRTQHLRSLRAAVSFRERGWAHVDADVLEWAVDWAEAALAVNQHLSRVLTAARGVVDAFAGAALDAEHLEALDVLDHALDDIESRGAEAEAELARLTPPKPAQEHTATRAPGTPVPSGDGPIDWDFARGVRAYSDWLRKRSGFYPTSIFLPDSTSPDASAARALRWVCDDWTAMAEQDLLGQASPIGRPRRPVAVAGELDQAAQTDLAEVLHALAHGADVSSADMKALAREPLAVIASIGARAQVHPTTCAAFWLIAQIELGVTEPDDTWVWHPAGERVRPLRCVLETDDDDTDD